MLLVPVIPAAALLAPRRGRTIKREFLSVEHWGPVCLDAAYSARRFLAPSESGQYVTRLGGIYQAVSHEDGRPRKKRYIARRR